MANSAWNGGALYLKSSTSLVDCTITGNTSAGHGGGIFSKSGLGTVATGYYSTKSYVTPGVLSLANCGHSSPNTTCSSPARWCSTRRLDSSHKNDRPSIPCSATRARSNPAESPEPTPSRWTANGSVESRWLIPSNEANATR